MFTFISMAIDILPAIVAVSNTAQEMKSSIKDFFLSSLVTFTEEILNGKLHFLYSKMKENISLTSY